MDASPIQLLVYIGEYPDLDRYIADIESIVGSKLLEKTYWSESGFYDLKFQIPGDTAEQIVARLNQHEFVSGTYLGEIPQDNDP